VSLSKSGCLIDNQRYLPLKKLSTHNLWFICVAVLCACVPLSWARACDSITLPKEVRSTIEKEFGRWNFVTPELLSSPDDRQIWNQNYSGECPGIISGHFTGQEIGYEINLAKGSGKGLEQQDKWREYLATWVPIWPRRSTSVCWPGKASVLSSARS
jgi:hypothetical protein